MLPFFVSNLWFPAQLIYLPSVSASASIAYKFDHWPNCWNTLL